ncbi:MAG: HTH domain-containing protein [Planctomycetota bacterium]
MQRDIVTDNPPIASRHARLLRLVDELNRQESTKPQELAIRLGISLRTLYRDLKVLREAGYAVSLSQGARKTNQTELQSFKMPVSVRERYALHMLLNGLKSLPHYGPNNDAVRGLEKMLALMPMTDNV